MFSRVLLPWHLAALTFFLFLKIGVQNASPEALVFLLKPVSVLLTLFTGASAVWISGRGAFFPAWKVLMDSSCAGVSFWALSFGIIHLFLAQRERYRKSGFKAFLCALAGSYMLAIPVNAIRIYLSLFLREKVVRFLPHISLTALHQAIGVAVQITLLSLLYLSLNHFLRAEKTVETAPE